MTPALLLAAGLLASADQAAARVVEKHSTEAPARAQQDGNEGTLDLVVMGLAAAADQASTLYAQQHGAVELIPLMRNPAVAIALKAAAVVLFAAICAELREMGHTVAAKVLRWAVAGTWLGIAGHNVHVAGRIP